MSLDGFDEIEMFVLEPPTVAREVAGSPPPTPEDDGAASDHETLEDGSLAQRSGTGTWPNGDRAVRTGHCEEVLVTMAHDRLAALAEIDPNNLFTPRLNGLIVDPASLRRSAAELAWDGELRTMTGVRRKANLRIYRSPSGNVTVLTLIPATPSKFFPTAFIRPGLRSMNELRARIDAATTGRRSTSRTPGGS